MGRLAHVISTPRGFGGAEAVMVALLEGGGRRGWEQLVLNPFAASAGEELRERCRDYAYEAYPANGSRALAAIPARRWMRARLREFDPDFLQAYLLHAQVAAATLPRSSETVTVMCDQQGSHLAALDRPVAARLERIAARRFDHIVACSRAVERYLVEQYALPTDSVTCIRNGWSGSPLTWEPPHVPTVVCTANFRPQKGHHILLDAFATVTQEVPGARLVLLGEGEELAAAQRQAADLGIARAVDFAGAQADVWPWLARSSVFVLASSYEPLGIAVLEAMAAGLPVVASGVDGINELVENGVTGILVQPGDSVMLAHELISLLRDPARAESLGSRAQTAAEDSRMERCVDAYFDLYERLADSQ